jgi:hypothetical protein
VYDYLSINRCAFKWNRFGDKKLEIIAGRKFFLYRRMVGTRGNPSLFFRFRKSGLKSAVIKMFLKMTFITEWFIFCEDIKTIF